MKLLHCLACILPALALSVVDYFNDGNATVDSSSSFKLTAGNVSVNSDYFGAPIPSVFSDRPGAVTKSEAELTTATSQPTWEEEFFTSCTASHELSVTRVTLSAQFYNPKTPTAYQNGLITYVDTGAAMFIVADDVVRALQLPRLPSTCWFITTTQPTRTYGQYVAAGLRLTSDQGANFTVEMAACSIPGITANVLPKTFLKVHNSCQGLEDKFRTAK
jgi:hypothetical protein